ncbi:unnamed protein product, partial [Ectocarpus sp. 13 AM-2016]
VEKGTTLRTQQRNAEGCTGRKRASTTGPDTDDLRAFFRNGWQSWSLEATNSINLPMLMSTSDGIYLLRTCTPPPLGERKRNKFDLQQDAQLHTATPASGHSTPTICNKILKSTQQFPPPDFPLHPRKTCQIPV